MRVIGAVLCCLGLIALGVPVWAVTAIAVSSFLFGLIRAAVHDWRSR